jgi:hypothetical protein
MSDSTPNEKGGGSKEEATPHTPALAQPPKPRMPTQQEARELFHRSREWDRQCKGLTHTVVKHFVFGNPTINPQILEDITRPSQTKRGMIRICTLLEMREQRDKTYMDFEATALERQQAYDAKQARRSASK